MAITKGRIATMQELRESYNKNKASMSFSNSSNGQVRDLPDGHEITGEILFFQQGEDIKDAAGKVTSAGRIGGTLVEDETGLRYRFSVDEFHFMKITEGSRIVIKKRVIPAGTIKNPLTDEVINKDDIHMLKVDRVLVADTVKAPTAEELNTIPADLKGNQQGKK